MSLKESMVIGMGVTSKVVRMEGDTYLGYS